MDVDQNIEATDSADDSDAFTNQRQVYMIKSRKRQLELNTAEDIKRKVGYFDAHSPFSLVTQRLTI